MLDPKPLVSTHSVAVKAQNSSNYPSVEPNHRYSLRQVATFIEPILNAPKRCEVSHFYIQAVSAGRHTLISTNLPDGETTTVSDVATSWVIGRSSNCAIAVLDRRVSRCHAVIGFTPQQGFYLMDLGSSNGTFLNQQKLVPLEQYPLQDADIITLSQITVEFFISGWTEVSGGQQDTQSFAK